MLTSQENAAASPIGRSTPRIDGPLKVSGKAQYTPDFHFPGLLYAVPVEAKIANGRVVKLDTTVTQLFRSTSDSGIEGVAGWIYEPGLGRLCHLANGHTRDALAHPTYQRILRNSLQWCTRQEIAVD